MVEELKVLLPLLQQAGEGAFWIAILFIAKGLLSNLLIFGMVLTIAWMVQRTVIRLNTESDSDLPLHERMRITRLHAAYEAVREAWLYGKHAPEDGVTLQKMYHDLGRLCSDKE